MLYSSNIQAEFITEAITNEQVIKDILCDIPYASVHWICNIKTSIKYTDLQGECVEDKWFDCLKKGGALLITENDEDMYPVHLIKYNDLDKAVSKIRKLPKFLIANNWDGTFADAIMQSACFNEIVYD